VTDPTRYPAQVFWSDEDEGYIAVAPDLAGCSALGETEETAHSELRSAIAAWIDAASAAGKPVPAPSPSPSYPCSRT
jgi:predicted RNase H-like HicB family nuclease